MAIVSAHGGRFGRVRGFTPVETLASRHAPGGADRLFADARVAALLAGGVRDRALGRWLGVSKDQAGLAGLVVLLVAGQAAYGAGKRALAPGGPPTAADGMLMAATARELLLRAVGLPAEGTALLGTLLVAAVALRTARRAATRSGRGIRASSSRANAQFHHRYGYLIDPGHWREQRAARRPAAAPPAASQGRVATSATAATDGPAPTAGRPQHERPGQRRVARADRRGHHARAHPWSARSAPTS